MRGGDEVKLIYSVCCAGGERSRMTGTEGIGQSEAAYIGHRRATMVRRFRKSTNIY